MPRNEKKSNVAAVVVTYNRLELLRQCVEALRAQTTVCDILIVDNASTDGTAQWLASQPDLHYRNTGSNLGGAGGFNCGMRWAVEAGYDYVWVMDDDTLPQPDALEKLLEADSVLEGNYGWLSSKCLWTDGKLCPMNLQRVSPYKEISLKETDTDTIPAHMASFVSLFLRKKSILQYGLPITDFFIWVDDWEYTRRISREANCYVVSGSTVIHAMKDKTIVNIAADTAERLPRYGYFYRNDVYLYRKEGLYGWVWLIAKDLWHSVQVLLHPNTQKIQRICTIWRGFCAGCRFRPTVEMISRENEEARLSCR